VYDKGYIWLIAHIIDDLENVEFSIIGHSIGTSCPPLTKESINMEHRSISMIPRYVTEAIIPIRGIAKMDILSKV
jgi:hypothetical protein